MNHIISNLFLGSFEDSINSDQLVKNKILHIINVAKECEHKNKNNEITYHKFNINDNDDINESILRDVYELIDFFCDHDENVLIHCRHGISRSAVFVIYYLMKKNNLKLQDSLIYIQKKRPIVDPSITFLNILYKHISTSEIIKLSIEHMKKIIDVKIDDKKLTEIIQKNNFDYNKIINFVLSNN